MKTYFFALGISLLALSACNSDNKTTATTTDSTANKTAVNDSGNTTTTTTTTTTVVTHSPANRQLMTVKTNKPIKVVYDSVHYRYVDVTTNQEPSTYYYDPATHDTFDYRGYILNNALVYSNGEPARIDTVVLYNNPYNVEVRDTIIARQQSGNYKMKQKGNTYKEKTDTSKTKVTKNSVKMKSN